MALLEWVEFLPELVALATYPDRLPAPRPVAGSATANVFTAALASPPFVPSVYPDRLARPRLASVSSWVAMPPQPERTAPIAGATFPDAVRRPALLTALHYAAGPPPAPEGTIPLDWQGTAPAAVRRPSLAAAHHLAVALPPQPEESVPDGWRGVWPERVGRPRAAPADGAAFVFVPAPIVAPSFPDALPRLPRRLLAAPLVVLPPPLTPVSHPDATRRPYLAPAAHPFFADGRPPGAPFAISPCPVVADGIEPQPNPVARVESMPVVACEQVETPTGSAAIVAMPGPVLSLRCGC